MSICLWFQAQKMESEKCGVQKLFTIAASGGGVECYMAKGWVYYRVLSGQYTEPSDGANAMQLLQVVPGQWTFLGISHEPQKKLTSSHLYVYHNNEQPKQRTLNFPQVSANSAVEKFAIGADFFGKIETVLLMNSASSKVKTIQQFHIQGLQGFAQIKNLTHTLEKHVDKLMAVLIPERVHDTTVHDLVGDYHGVLQPRTGAISANLQVKVAELGGLNLVLCLIALADDKTFPICLQLLNLLLRNRLPVPSPIIYA